MVEAILKVLCPGPGYEEFKSDVLCHLYKNQMKKKKNIETANVNNTIMNVKSTQNLSQNQYTRTVQEKLESVITTLCTWSNKSRKGSIE